MHKFTRAVREAADALLPNASQRDRVIHVITVVMFDRRVWSLVPFLKLFRGRLVGLVHVANDELKCQRQMVNFLRHRVEHCLAPRFGEQPWLEVGAEVFT